MKLNTALTIIFFGIIYCSISLVNHYNFRTYALDLGLFNNALYDYSIFQKNEITVTSPLFRPNFLGDHFSLYPLLFSPLRYIMGSYTLLVVQILSILFGGLGIFKLIKLLTDNENIAKLAMIHFFSIWGIYSALSFDYHDNVVAAMLVPWFILYFKQDKYILSGLFFVLIIIAKENMALWMAFICLGLVFEYWRERKKVFILSVCFIFAFFYFYSVVNYIIPSINAEDERAYYHFQFHILGNNFKEVIINLISQPINSIKLLFVNPTNEPFLDGIKIEFWIGILLSGGMALALRPSYFIMILPVLAQKLYHDDPVKWGIGGHYSIELVPILTIALFVFITQFKNRVQYIIASISILFCLFFTLQTLDNRKSIWFSRENSRFYSKIHYKSEFNTKVIHESLNLIPDHKTVSAQAMLSPHLALRDRIYSFPYIGDAEFIAILPKSSNTYPISRESYNQLVDSISKSPFWEKIADNDIFIFQRVNK